VIHGSFEAWRKGTKLPRAHPIHVMFGPALKIDGLKSDEVLTLIDRTLRDMLEEVQQKAANC